MGIEHRHTYTYRDRDGGKGGWKESGYLCLTELLVPLIMSHIYRSLDAREIHNMYACGPQKSAEKVSRVVILTASHPSDEQCIGVTGEPSE